MQYQHFNKYNLQFTQDGCSSPSPQPKKSEQERQEEMTNLQMGGSGLRLRPHRFSNVNQAQFVARL